MFFAFSARRRHAPEAGGHGSKCQGHHAATPRLPRRGTETADQFPGTSIANWQVLVSQSFKVRVPQSFQVRVSRRLLTCTLVYTEHVEIQGCILDITKPFTFYS